MTIGPVQLNAVISRSDDIGLLKKFEDSKPVTDQQNIQVQVDKREDNLAHHVTRPNEASKLANNQDAKDEGNGMYFASENKRERKEKKNTDKIIKKHSTSMFDIKI